MLWPDSRANRASLGSLQFSVELVDENEVGAFGVSLGDAGAFSASVSNACSARFFRTSPAAADPAATSGFPSGGAGPVGDAGPVDALSAPPGGPAAMSGLSFGDTGSAGFSRGNAGTPGASPGGAAMSGFSPGDAGCAGVSPGDASSADALGISFGTCGSAAVFWF